MTQIQIAERCFDCPNTAFYQGNKTALGRKGAFCFREITCDPSLPRICSKLYVPLDFTWISVVLDVHKDVLFQDAKARRVKKQCG